jgi:hypothetical protein
MAGASMMGAIWTAIWTVLQPALTAGFSTAAVLGVLYWFVQQWFGAKIKSSFDRAAEDYKFELTAHAQGAKIAEYASIVFRGLEGNDPPEKYQRANQLSWELFLWLPPDTYRKLGAGLTGDRVKLADAMTLVRRQLLKDRAGNLGPNDIIVHHPGIGKQKGSPTNEA